MAVLFEDHTTRDRIEREFRHLAGQVDSLTRRMARAQQTADAAGGAAVAADQQSPSYISLVALAVPQGI